MQLRSRHSLILLLWIFTAANASFGALSCRQLISALGPEFFYQPGFVEAMGEATPLQAQGLWDFFITVIDNWNPHPGVQKAAEFSKLLPPGDHLRLLNSFDNKLFLGHPHYQSQLHATDRRLPRSGTILEIGCGSGLSCMSLQFAGPERDFILVDANKHYMEIALENMRQVRRRLEANGTKAKEPVAHVKNILDLSIPPGSIDGAILNHALVYLDYEGKVATLRLLFNILRSGGVVVIHDPLAEWGDPEYLKFKTLDETVRHGNVVIYDIDIFAAAANWTEQAALKLDDDFPLFMPSITSPDWVVSAAKTIGFKVLHGRASKYHSYARTVLIKP